MKMFRYILKAKSIQKLIPRYWEASVEQGSELDALLEMDDDAEIAVLEYKHPLPEMLVEAYGLTCVKTKKQKKESFDKMLEEAFQSNAAEQTKQR